MILPMQDFKEGLILTKCSEENAWIISIQHTQELWLATQDLTDET